MGTISVPHDPTVFIVDDDESVRRSIEWLVGSVGLKAESFASARTFLDAFDPDRPGCLIVDMRMADISGLELQEWLMEHGATLPVIVMTAFGDVKTAVRAMKHGAIDFIEKPFNEQQVLELIQNSIAEDATRRQQDVDNRLVGESLKRLTPREREVLEFVVKGLSNKEIAREMGIVPKTVEVHRARVMEKMEARSLADLVRRFSLFQQRKG